MYAWQFAKAQHIAELHGWTKFVSMQNHYNLLYREEEREMLPLCADQGVGVIPWSPLARGRLTREWDATTPAPRPTSSAASLYRDEDRAIVDTVAGGRRAPRRVRAPRSRWPGCSPSPWSPHPSSGVTKPQHLADAVAAVDLELGADEVEELGAGYAPHAIAGHR